MMEKKAAAGLYKHCAWRKALNLYSLNKEVLTWGIGGFLSAD
jgi:hypothetical protein